MRELKVRIIQKHDIEENWRQTIDFIPENGEIIIYEIDDSHNYVRFKIGDGETNINNLPFSNTLKIDDAGIMYM